MSEKDIDIKLRAFASSIVASPIDRSRIEKLVQELFVGISDFRTEQLSQVLKIASHYVLSSNIKLTSSGPISLLIKSAIFESWQKLNQFDSEEAFSSLIHSCAQLAFREEKFYEQWVSIAKHSHVCNFNAKSLADSTWALSKIGYIDREFNIVAMDRASSRNDFDLYSSINFLWGMARFMIAGADSRVHSLGSQSKMNVITSLFEKIKHSEDLDSVDVANKHKLYTALSTFGEDYYDEDFYYSKILSWHKEFRTQPAITSEMQSKVAKLLGENMNGVEIEAYDEAIGSKVDILIRSRKLVIQIDGPHHFIDGDVSKPNLETLVNTNLIKKRSENSNVIRINYKQIDNEDYEQNLIEGIKKLPFYENPLPNEDTQIDGEWTKVQAGIYVTKQSYIEHPHFYPKKIETSPISTSKKTKSKVKKVENSIKNQASYDDWFENTEIKKMTNKESVPDYKEYVQSYFGLITKVNLGIELIDTGVALTRLVHDQNYQNGLKFLYKAAYSINQYLDITSYPIVINVLGSIIDYNKGNTESIAFRYTNIGINYAAKYVDKHYFKAPYAAALHMTLITILAAKKTFNDAHQLLENPKKLESKVTTLNKSRDREFIKAIKNLDLEKARIELEKGANVEAPIKLGKTPLGYIVGMLIVKNIFFERLEIDDLLGSPTLQILHNKKLQDIFKLLIEKGANINQVNTNGYTFLILAVQADNLDVAKLLLEHGAKVDQTNKEDLPPLLFAVANDKIEMAKLLLEHGAKVDQTHEKGNTTPLIIALANDRIEMAKLLLTWSQS